MKRRTFLSGMAGILASGFAPAVVGSGVLMPVRTIVKPVGDVITLDDIERIAEWCRDHANPLFYGEIRRWENIIILSDHNFRMTK